MNAEARYQIHSAAKSFTSTCLGLLIDDGKASLDTLAAEFVPELREGYPTVTFRHFAESPFWADDLSPLHVIVLAHVALCERYWS